MFNPAKVSIVVPSYNQGQFLEECLQSIFDQRWPNLEVIVMDGGSKDNSVEIIKKFEKQITYWQSHRDGGQTPAINAGFAKATGQIVGWLNSDDAYLSGCIGRAVDAFHADRQVVIVQGQMQMKDEATGSVEIRSNPGEIDFSRILNGEFSLNQPGAFFRRSAMDLAGPLDGSLNYVMDFEYWLRLCRFGTIKEIPSVQAMHRMHADCKTMGDFASTFVPEIRRVRKRYGGAIFCLKEWNLIRIQLGKFRQRSMAYFHKRPT